MDIILIIQRIILMKINIKKMQAGPASNVGEHSMAMSIVVNINNVKNRKEVCYGN